MSPLAEDRAAERNRIFEVSVRVLARLLRSPMTWLLAAAGATYGFFFFCYPEIRLLAAAPPGWRPFWGDRRPAWLICTTIVVATAAVPTLVRGLVFFLIEWRRLRIASRPRQSG